MIDPLLQCGDASGVSAAFNGGAAALSSQKFTLNL
jgi:hypothetical protein